MSGDKGMSGRRVGGWVSLMKIDARKGTCDRKCALYDPGANNGCRSDQGLPVGMTRIKKVQLQLSIPCGGRLLSALQPFLVEALQSLRTRKAT